MELKFGTGVNSEALISNSSKKIRYKDVEGEKGHFLRKTEIFAQALLDKFHQSTRIVETVLAQQGENLWRAQYALPPPE